MPMHDPLSLIPIRYKLPLTFIFLCLVAFGLGSYLVVSVASESLERQILLRLNERAASTHLVIDNELETLGRRVEDFASDGHIRLMLERLQADQPEEGVDQRAEHAAELERHLRANKLPLVSEFAEAFLFGESGEVLVSTSSDPASASLGFDREALWYGPLQGATPSRPFPSFVLSTPVRAIDGGGSVGFLQIVVRAPWWADGFRRSLAGGPVEGLRIELRSNEGVQLPLVMPASSVRREEPDALTYSSPNQRTGWQVEVSVDRRNLTLPISTLMWRFIYVGLILPVLTVLLLIPLRQFLLKPLAALQAAALRITEGDFSARVDYQAEDEVGHLSRAFDMMAAAVEERTGKLATAADELRRSEAAIRLQRDRLNTVIHSMDDGLFILDRDGEVTLANESAGTVLRELSTGRRGHANTACKSRPNPTSCFECIADFDHPTHPCIVAVTGRVFEIQATPLRDDDALEVGRVFVSRDVTDRLREADQQAHQERLSVLGEVAAVMAHEMNNPLAAISMFSQMLLKGLDPSSPEYTHAEVVHRNTESCKHAIRSLLDMATSAPAEHEDFDVRDLVDDVVRLLHPVAQRSDTVLSVDFEADDGLMRGDELQLRQALVNLVMNAIQAVAKEEDGVVRVGTEDRGQEVVIRVEDNGPGIPAELREHVFEPFFTTKPPGEGTGLGLPTTRRIVLAHAGALDVGDSDDGGASIELCFPRRPSTQIAADSVSVGPVHLAADVEV